MNTLKQLFLGIVISTGIIISPYAQSAKPEATEPTQIGTKAKIVAINGNSITIENKNGAKKILELTTTNSLKLGQNISWCEEDCRVLNMPNKSQVLSNRAVKR